MSLARRTPRSDPMKRELITKLAATLEKLVHKETATGTEFWLARDLQHVLGYARWSNFEKVIQKAMASCELAGNAAGDHFLPVDKIEELAATKSNRSRSVSDFALTRYACYLTAQNANSAKEAVAFAQTYFALQTRRQEIIESRLADQERVDARKKLGQSEKVLSGLIYEHVENEAGFRRIRTKGDQALFGGVTTRQMKRRLGTPKGRALADFLPTITIKAKDFANEITNFSIRRDYLHTEAQITREHIKNNRSIRKLLGRRKIKPEELPPAEDVKKVERRLLVEQKSFSQEARLADSRLAQAPLDRQLVFAGDDQAQAERNGRRARRTK
ncbi:MAG TPA: DNA damage-inducible protein D [Lacipirellulaceae bacterium]|nr:DNA damage-inducible protein D [Lacipirellulaceae bacterium]